MEKPDLLAERPVGIEFEYVPTRRRHHDSLQIDDARGIIHALQRKHGKGPRYFLGNGYRAYEDGELAEVCTPVTSPDKIGVVQLGSERMIIDVLRAMTLKGAIKSWAIPLRVDDGNKTSGYHENYHMYLPGDGDNVTKTMKLMSRVALASNVWTGQGMVSLDKASFDARARFVLAQKTMMSGSAQRGSHEALQIKHRSDIDIAHRLEFRRPNYPLTHWQLKHRMAFFSGAMRMAEMELLYPSQQDEDLGKAHKAGIKRATKRHGSGDFTTYNMGIVGDLSYDVALDYVRILSDRLVTTGESLGFPEYEIEAAKEVNRVVSLMIDGDLPAVEKLVPWVYKQRALRRIAPDTLTVNGSTNRREIMKARGLDIALDSRGTDAILDRYRAVDPMENYGMVNVDPSRPDELAPWIFESEVGRAQAVRQWIAAGGRGNPTIRWMNPYLSNINEKHIII